MLFNELRDLPVLGQMMVKPVDSTVTEVSTGLRWRDMQAEETEPFFEQVRELLADNNGARREVKEEWDAAMKTASEIIKRSLPEGAATAGHILAVIEDAKKGEKVAVLWVAMQDGNTSFCHDIEVEKGMRGRGLGKKTLIVWEAIAAKLGATSMRLHVFRRNTVALKLYEGAGFEVESGIFRLDTKM
jgi:ribosomal protein S18 acetylase RimI-like enzyme